MADYTQYILDLVDVNGLPLTQGGLENVEGAALTIQDGQPDVFQGVVRLDSEAAEAILAAGLGVDRDVYLKAYEQPAGTSSPLDRTLRFYGPVWVANGQGSARRLAFNAYSPDVILQRRFTLAQFSPTDLGTLIKTMIDTTNSTDGETGIRTNSANITATSSIDLDARTNRPAIQAIRAQFAAMLDGVETWFVPIELASGKICDLYCGPARGTNSDALFAFGAGTEANCLDMSFAWDTMRVTNDANGYADDAVTPSQKTDATSIASIRRLVEYVSFTGETDATVLAARTQGVIDAKSTRAKVMEWTATPGPDAPQLFADFEVGDTVPLHFREGGVEYVVDQRVRSAKVSISPSGVARTTEIGFRE